MSQNPFDQQQPNNYGQGFSPAPNQYPPQKKSNTGRNCLLIFLGAGGLMVVGCIILTVVSAFAIKEVVEEVVDEYGNTLIAYSWAGSLTTGEFEGVVCEGSAAEAYSLKFVEDNPNITNFEILSSEEDADGEKVTLSGTITYGTGEVRSYSATLFFKKDENNSGFSEFGFNCLDGIEGNFQ